MPGAASEPVLRVTPSLGIPHSELRWRFSRSGGPGGQHANTADTRVEVRFDISGSPSLTTRQRELLLRRFGSELRVSVGEERSQLRNREVALRRLAERVAGGLHVDPPRRPTRPGRGAVERRLLDKKRRADRKQQRRRPDLD
jgi:ribosome-associated protein